MYWKVAYRMKWKGDGSPRDEWFLVWAEKKEEAEREAETVAAVLRQSDRWEFLGYEVTAY